MGFRQFPVLPVREVAELIQLLFSLFSQFWSIPAEFEHVWSSCAEDSAVFSSWACAACPAGPIVTMYFAVLVVCFACPSVQGLGRPGNKLMATVGTHVCFELAGLFASPL